MKTKAYRNDNLQSIISYQNKQLDTPEINKFIVGAAMNAMTTDIKQEFIQKFNQINEEAMNITGFGAQTINVIYEYSLWAKIIQGYSEADRTIYQIAKLYEEGRDPNSHFKKLAELIHRYLRKICRKATAQSVGNQAYVLLKSPQQYNSKQEAIIHLIRKWVAQEEVSLDIIIFSGNENHYIISMIEYQCIKPK